MIWHKYKFEFSGKIRVNLGNGITLEKLEMTLIWFHFSKSMVYTYQELNDFNPNQARKII